MSRSLNAFLVLLGAAGLLWWTYPPARVLLADWVPGNWIPVTNSAPAEPPAKAARKGPPPAPVTAATVTLRDMPIILSAPGTVEAAATVAVKARVDGQIVDVTFNEGDLVRKGQVLYRFDDRLVRAQIEQAEANIKRDEATLADAVATLGRRNALVEKKIVSEAAMDTAKSSVAALKAAITAGQAALEAQRTLLDYLTVTAPISGRTGSTAVKAGSNVRAADTTPLVTINQTQPVSVAFAVPQSEIAALRRALAAKSTAEVTLPGQKPETREGRIDFIENQVDKQTGTLTAKIEVANADELLWPGQAVEVSLKVEVRRDMLAVPASAVLPAQQGMIVWVIGQDGRVAPRTVILDRQVDQTAFLASGVTAGERVVTDGHIRIAPGSPVTVQEPGKGPPAAGPKGGKGGDPADRKS